MSLSKINKTNIINVYISGDTQLKTVINILPFLPAYYFIPFIIYDWARPLQVKNNKEIQRGDEKWMLYIKNRIVYAPPTWLIKYKEANQSRLIL